MKTYGKINKKGFSLLVVMSFMLSSAMLGSGMMYMASEQSKTGSGIYAKQTAEDAALSGLDWFEGSIADYATTESKKVALMNWLATFNNSTDAKWYNGNSDLVLAFTADNIDDAATVSVSDKNINAKVKIESYDNANGIMTLQIVGLGFDNSKKTKHVVYKVEGMSSEFISNSAPYTGKYLKYGFAAEKGFFSNQKFTVKNNGAYIGDDPSSSSVMNLEAEIDGDLKIMNQKEITINQNFDVGGNLFINGDLRLNKTGNFGSVESKYVVLNGKTIFNQPIVFNADAYVMGFNGNINPTLTFNGDAYLKYGGDYFNQTVKFNDDAIIYGTSDIQTNAHPSFIIADNKSVITNVDFVNAASASEVELLGEKSSIDFTTNTGMVVPKSDYKATIEVLGAAMSYGATYDMPVTARIKIGNDYYEPWGDWTSPTGGDVTGQYVNGKSNNGHGNNIDGVDVSNPGNSKTGLDTDTSIDDEKKTVSGANTKFVTANPYQLGSGISIDASSWYKKKSTDDGTKDAQWKEYRKLQSQTDNNGVKILKNGDPIPQVDAYLIEEYIQGFVKDYVKDGKIVLNSNQALYLFEFSNDANNVNDYNDLVMLATINPPSESVDTQTLVDAVVEENPIADEDVDDGIEGLFLNDNRATDIDIKSVLSTPEYSTYEEVDVNYEKMRKSVDVSKEGVRLSTLGTLGVEWDRDNDGKLDADEVDYLYKNGLVKKSPNGVLTIIADDKSKIDFSDTDHNTLDAGVKVAMLVDGEEIGNNGYGSDWQMWKTTMQSTSDLSNDDNSASLGVFVSERGSLYSTKMSVNNFRGIIHDETHNFELDKAINMQGALIVKNHIKGNSAITIDYDNDAIGPYFDLGIFLDPLNQESYKPEGYEVFVQAMPEQKTVYRSTVKPVKLYEY